MTPFFFGTGARRLFGAYTPARGTRSSLNAPQAVVVCPPWGPEHLRAHRSLHRLASELAGVGCHVLRFDYFGTGDSGGDMPDADLEGWKSDIATAIQELQDTAEVKRVALVGLRLGATLAAAVAAQRKDINSLVLWDPLLTGAKQLEDLRNLAQTTSPLGLRPKDAGRHLLGFALTEAMAAQLADLTLPSSQLPTRTLTILSQDPLLRTSVDVATEVIQTPPAWIEEQGFGAGAVPVRILRRIVEWLSA